MKDIVIKGNILKRELIILCICFVVVNLLNVFAIWQYDTQWDELYKVWYAVLLVTVILYVVLIPLRFIAYWIIRGIRSVIKKKKK